MPKTNDNDGVSVHTGFPNPATDASLASLDLNRLFIKHPSSTFLMRLDGQEWQDEGIYNGDILIIDRAKDPSQKDLLIWTNDEGFLVGKKKDLPAGSENWGVVTAIIRQTSP